jgi:hypothetical protein
MQHIFINYDIAHACGRPFMICLHVASKIETPRKALSGLVSCPIALNTKQRGITSSIIDYPFLDLKPYKALEHI